MKCPNCGADEKKLYCEEIGLIRYTLPVKDGSTVWEKMREKLFKIESHTLFCTVCKKEFDYALGDGNRIIL